VNQVETPQRNAIRQFEADPRPGGTKLPPIEIIAGKTPEMASIVERLRKVAATTIPVLITGASGTGKEVLAHLLHQFSPLANRPLVQLNCAAIPPSLLESELFGYEKGSFTGAFGSKPGRIELANSGTLFLDEIGELDPAVQAKLLQLLPDGQYTRIGGHEERRVNARFIFATNRDLEEQIAAGHFREDLFFRINVMNFRVPPLRERLEDVPELAQYFLAKYNERYNRRVPMPSEDLMARMQQYSWPGNIRQLENSIQRYVVLDTEQAICNELEKREPDVFKFILPADGRVSLKQISRQAARQIERKVILKVIEASGWNRKQAAKLLNISYRALLYKLKEAGMTPNRRRRKDSDQGLAN